MTEFGLHLKQARERRGISLRQIAGATKISAAALEALERGDPSRLPGGIFSRAFVRAYAIEVGLQPDETVRRYAELSDAMALVERRAAPVEISDDDRAFLERQRQATQVLKAVAAIVFVLLVGLVAWWMTRSSGAKSAAATTPTAEASSPSPVAAAPPAQGDAPAAPPVAQRRPLMIQLRAAASCWVQATADGRQVLSRNLSAGESPVIEADKQIDVKFGDAGAVEWTINGQPGKPLGAAGEVKSATITVDNVAQFIQAAAIK